jgi:hypothetical protein
MAKEIKAGDAVDFQIGDKVLTVEAVPYGNVKKVFKVVFEAIQDMSSDTGEAALMKVPRIMEEKVGAVLPLLFRKDRYDFLTSEWIDENLTINDIRGIIETAIKVNGLEDFFAKMGNKFPKVESPAEDSLVRPTVA